MQHRVKALSCLLSLVGAFGCSAAHAQIADAVTATPSRLTKPIDESNRVTLKGNVLRGLTSEKDLGMVEDSLSVRLYLSFQRTPAQQADLDSLLAAQQNPKSQMYHKWLTPEQFGARFGASESDTQKIQEWLEAQGFEVTSVAKNASVINFKATSAGIRETFHTQLHYWNVAGGKYAAPANEPTIPAAFAGIVSGIAGLNNLPTREHHTPLHQERYDADTHKWYTVQSLATEAAAAQTHYDDGNGHYNMTPQDYYTIYNVNPTFAAGNVGAGATIGIIGSGYFNYGTVSGGDAGGTATGGDAATFRKLFGITTPMKLQIEHGSKNFPCSGTGGSESGESALDVEWAGALAPGATLILENCTDGNAFVTEVQALVDANVADIISSSVGFSEAFVDSATKSSFDTAFAQAAAQGQTILSAQGDAGSDDTDFGAAAAVSGLSIDFPGSSPLVLSVGGTDFQDSYDVDAGSTVPQSTYWSSTNSKFYADALGYVPETVWDDSCGSPLVAAIPAFGGSPGLSTPSYCAIDTYAPIYGGGGGGGVSILYPQPSWQKGMPGLAPTVTQRATPDVSMFASSGTYWGHTTVLCDSSAAASACTSPSTFGTAGGTSFAAPEFAGILGLLKTGTGSRQGLIQPAMYALAKAQYAAGTACYANGQTKNTGITTGLPANSCIFHDVTTNSNDEGCQAGTPNCFSNPGASNGVLTSSGNTSTFVDGYAAGPHYDIATGLGSVNVTNLINKWNTAFTSTTTLKANPTSIAATASTVLTATVTGGQPPNAGSPAPALSGSITFTAGSVKVGTCTLSGGTCSATVQGSALQPGANSITATFAGSGTYPSSTSSIVTVTVTATSTSNFTITPLPASETIYRGQLAGFVLKLTSVNGFNANVTLSCSGMPAGSKCGNFPQTVKVNGVAYAVAGILFPKNTVPGTYVVTFTGVSGSLTNKATATFIVK